MALRNLCNPRISVIIPTKNESENLCHVLPFINPEYEVIIVDCSTDTTTKTARILRPNIIIIPQQGQGKGSALKQGFAVATGDIIVMMDADGSTAPNEIDLFLQALLNGADFAKGSRYLAKAGSQDFTFFRWLGNSLFTLLVRILFNVSFTDLCYGYNAFWADTLPVYNFADNYGNGFEIETIINLRALVGGLSIQEVPSLELSRQHGRSHLRAIPDGLRVLKVILNEYLLSLTMRHSLAYS
ncbi:glycosyltransferase family 2 protein [Patescibacteria group bacterium]|nr:glycosyltransferase family 2 protein [Patescibacteria group bacterium]